MNYRYLIWFVNWQLYLLYIWTRTMVAHSEFRNFPAGLMNQLFPTGTPMKSNFHNELASKRIFELVFLHFRQRLFSCTVLFFFFSRVFIYLLSPSSSRIQVKIYVFKRISPRFWHFPRLFSDDTDGSTVMKITEETKYRCHGWHLLKLDYVDPNLTTVLMISRFQLVRINEVLCRLR